MTTATEYQVSLATYVAECQRLFGADRYGWSLWEQDAAQAAHLDGIPAQDAVYDMNDRYVRRRADRNA